MDTNRTKDAKFKLESSNMDIQRKKHVFVTEETRRIARKYPFLSPLQVRRKALEMWKQIPATLKASSELVKHNCVAESPSDVDATPKRSRSLNKSQTTTTRAKSTPAKKLTKDKDPKGKSDENTSADLSNSVEKRRVGRPRKDRLSADESGDGESKTADLTKSTRRTLSISRKMCNTPAGRPRKDGSTSVKMISVGCQFPCRKAGRPKKNVFKSSGRPRKSEDGPKGNADEGITARRSVGRPKRSQSSDDSRDVIRDKSSVVELADDSILQDEFSHEEEVTTSTPVPSSRTVSWKRRKVEVEAAVDKSTNMDFSLEIPYYDDGEVVITGEKPLKRMKIEAMAANKGDAAVGNSEESPGIDVSVGDHSYQRSRFNLRYDYSRKRNELAVTKTSKKGRDYSRKRVAPTTPSQSIEKSDSPVSTPSLNVRESNVASKSCSDQKTVRGRQSSSKNNSSNARSSGRPRSGPRNPVKTSPKSVQRKIGDKKRSQTTPRRGALRNVAVVKSKLVNGMAPKQGRRRSRLSLGSITSAKIVKKVMTRRSLRPSKLRNRRDVPSVAKKGETPRSIRKDKKMAIKASGDSVAKEKSDTVGKESSKADEDGASKDNAVCESQETERGHVVEDSDSVGDLNDDPVGANESRDASVVATPSSKKRGRPKKNDPRYRLSSSDMFNQILESTPTYNVRLQNAKKSRKAKVSQRRKPRGVKKQNDSDSDDEDDFCPYIIRNTVTKNSYQTIISSAIAKDSEGSRRKKAASSGASNSNYITVISPGNGNVPKKVSKAPSKTLENTKVATPQKSVNSNRQRPSEDTTDDDSSSKPIVIEEGNTDEKVTLDEESPESKGNGSDGDPEAIPEIPDKRYSLFDDFDGSERDDRQLPSRLSNKSTESVSESAKAESIVSRSTNAPSQDKSETFGDEEIRSEEDVVNSSETSDTTTGSAIVAEAIENGRLNEQIEDVRVLLAPDDPVHEDESVASGVDDAARDAGDVETLALGTVGDATDTRRANDQDGAVAEELEPSVGNGTTEDQQVSDPNVGDVTNESVPGSVRSGEALIDKLAFDSASGNDVTDARHSSDERVGDDNDATEGRRLSDERVGDVVCIQPNITESDAPSSTEQSDVLQLALGACNIGDATNQCLNLVIGGRVDVESPVSTSDLVSGCDVFIKSTADLRTPENFINEQVPSEIFCNNNTPALIAEQVTVECGDVTDATQSSPDTELMLPEECLRSDDTGNREVSTNNESDASSSDAVQNILSAPSCADSTDSITKVNILCAGRTSVDDDRFTSSTKSVDSTVSSIGTESGATLREQEVPVQTSTTTSDIPVDATTTGCGKEDVTLTNGVNPNETSNQDGNVQVESCVNNVKLITTDKQSPTIK